MPMVIPQTSSSTSKSIRWRPYIQSLLQDRWKNNRITSNGKEKEIRNSTAEFLTFVAEGKEQGVQVLYKDETVWATQKAMATLFDCSTDNISLHLKNIFKSGELQEDSVTEKNSATASDGKTYQTKFYNLDAIISVGYRVNSIRATQFRQWCTYVIRQFSLRGYIIDKKRMENGSFIGRITSSTCSPRYARSE